MPLDEQSGTDIRKIVSTVKEREAQGYAYDSADASFKVLVRELMGDLPDYYDVQAFRVLDERRWNAKGSLITVSEAKVKVSVPTASGKRKERLEVAEGNGPVDALYRALIRSLKKAYPSLKDVQLKDYKVRIVNPDQATQATTRVQIESEDEHGNRWTTIGVSGNVIDASFNALNDSFLYKLMLDG